MENETVQQLRSYYSLTRKNAALNREDAALKALADAAEAVWLTISADLDARKSGMGHMLRQLFKKADPELEALEADARDAEARYLKIKADYQRCHQELAANRTKRLLLPSLSILKRRAMADPETAKAYAVMEVRFCVEQVNPILEEILRALKEYLDLVPNGNFREGIEQSRYNHIYGDLMKLPEQSLPWLTRIGEALEILHAPFHIKEYFHSSKTFFTDATRRGNQNERTRDAIRQVETQKSMIETSLRFIDGIFSDEKDI